MKPLTRAGFLAGTLLSGGGMLALGRRLRRPPAPPTLPAESLVVAVLPVGQGEASWVRTPDGRFVVIGCGPGGAGRALADSLQSVGARRIDLLVLPTPYRESLGGVPELLAALPVGLAYDNGWTEPLNVAHRAAHASLKASGVPLYGAEAGQSIALGEGVLEFLHPSQPFVHGTPEGGNNAVVVRLRWGRTAFLWASGLERAGEEALLSRADGLAANWLRVARFGTDQASSPEWLRAVAPELAVISCGAAGRRLYPAPETVQRLEAAGARLWRTDHTAEPLLFFSDGTHVTAATAAG